MIDIAANMSPPPKGYPTTKGKYPPFLSFIMKLLNVLIKKFIFSLQAINAGEGVEKREPSYTVGGNAN